MGEKKIYYLGILLTAVCVLLLNNGVFAQSVTLSGTQIKKAGANSELKSNIVTLTVNHKIISQSGTHDGFWIARNEDAKIYAFYFISGVLSPNPINFVLKPGSYTVYPNIKTGKTDASVTLKLNPVQ
ncbi:MAG: hypothetical protein NTV87_10410 [Ignavibacteriae bacterium]|nr:hypothetical protein [Ignavibacteriota bacterium]